MIRRSMFFSPRIVSDEEQKSRDAKPRLEKFDLPRGVGAVFYMAFLYTSTGQKIYTGDYGRILKATKHLPTCHGWMVPYRGKRQIGQASPQLFGRTSWSSSKDYPQLRIRRTDHKHTPTLKRSSWIVEVIDTRNCEWKTIEVLRKIPKQYLRCLKRIRRMPLQGHCASVG